MVAKRTILVDPISSSYCSKKWAPAPTDGILVEGVMAPGRKTFDGLKTPLNSGVKRLENHSEVTTSVKVET